MLLSEFDIEPWMDTPRSGIQLDRVNRTVSIEQPAFKTAFPADTPAPALPVFHRWRALAELGHQPFVECRQTIDGINPGFSDRLSYQVLP